MTRFLLCFCRVWGCWFRPVELRHTGRYWNRLKVNIIHPFHRLHTAEDTASIRLSWIDIPSFIHQHHIQELRETRGARHPLHRAAPLGGTAVPGRRGSDHGMVTDRLPRENDVEST